MFGLRALTVTAVSIILLLGAAPVPAAAEPPAVYFSESFDAGLDAWWAEPGWSTTDNRAASGLSAYFGDDKGTPQPEDNDLQFCGDTICAHELRSPTFSIPSGPAHLYFWIYASITSTAWSPSFQVEVEPKSGDPHSVRDLLITPDLLEGWVFHADLSPYSGQEVRLVFTAFPPFITTGDEGVYLDDVLVTDRYTETESSFTVSGSGPAAVVSFVAEQEIRGHIEIEIAGAYEGPTYGYISTAQRETDPREIYAMVRGGGSALGFHMKGDDPANATYNIGAEASLQVLGMNIWDGPLFLTNVNSTLVLRSTLQVPLLEPGAWQYGIALFGAPGASSTIRVRLQDTSMDFAAAVGGAQVALDYPGGFKATFVSTVGGQLLAMVDGALQRTTNGPSIAWFPIYASHLEGLELTAPDGPLGGKAAYSGNSGVWRAAVAKAANGVNWPFPWALIAELPSLPSEETKFGPSLSSLPLTAPGSGISPPRQERLWSVAGPMACQAAAAGLVTPPGCHLHPLFFSLDSFRIASRADLKAITFSMHSPAYWMHPVDVTDMVNGYCLRVVAPAHLAVEQCVEADETVTLVEATEGHLLSDADILEFEVGVDHPGIALGETWFLNLSLSYGPS